MITREFDLMLYQEGNLLFINANQYDSGEQWIFTLYEENGVKYTPATGAIVGVKSDGHGIINTGTVDQYGRVVINETQQMTAAAGLATFELLIDNDTHGTANFKVDVEPRPADNADLSDSDLSLIQQAVDSAEVIVEVIGDSDPSEVIGEHVDDWLDNHPEATTTVQDGAITAPKINNSLWDKILVNEEASGAVASFDDGADDVPVSSLKVNLEPIQTGTGDPSPSNVRPIIAANGINVWDEQWELGGISNQNGTNYGASDRIRSKNYIPCLPSTTYYFKTPVTMGTVAFYNSSQTFISALSNFAGGTFTTPANTKYIKFCGTNAYGATYNNDISINYPSSYTAYQPYQGIMVERTGKNLLNPTTFSRTNNSGQANNSWARWNQFIPCDLSEYTLNCNFATSLQLFVANIYLFNEAGENLETVSKYYFNSNNLSFSITNPNAKYIRLAIYHSSSLENYDFSNAQLEYGTVPTTYEPYVGNSYPYTLGQTVYGGTVDLATGVLTVDKAIVDLGSLTWSTYSIASNCFSTVLNGGKFTGTNYSSDCICSNYKLADYITDLRDTDGTIGVGYANLSQVVCYVAVHDSRYSDASDFKTAVSGVQLVYKLATPTTVQLTPTEVKTLLGYNNISSNGTVEVIYHADTKLYVDKMTNVDNAIIAPTEEGFTATRNYTVNDLVIVNDILYKVTSNIATGSAITPNSNVTQTTLSALIKALS